MGSMEQNLVIELKHAILILSDKILLHLEF